MSLLPLARILIILGLTLLVAGILLYLVAKIGLPLFNLPGDIRIERENFTCVFALGTSIVLSILFTIGLNIIARYFNR